jgi:hypothetical protein
MLAKFGFFVAFLVLYFGLIVLAGYAVRNMATRYNDDGSWRPPTLRDEAVEQSLIVATPLYLVFIYLLTGFFNLTLSTLWVGSTIATTVVSLLVLRPGEDTRVKAEAHRTWATYTLVRKGLIGFCGVQVLSILFVVVFPIAVGIVYFTHSRPSLALTEAVLRVTLVTSTVVAYFVIGPILIAYMSSVALDDSTRTRMFIQRSVGLVPSAISFGLLFWAFQITSAGPSVSLGNAPIALSVTLVLLLFFVFVVTAVGPFAIGLERAKKHRVTLLETRREWLARVLEVFEVPNPDAESAELEALQKEIDNELQRIGKVSILPPPIDEESSDWEKRASWAATIVEDSDPTLKHYRWLTKLRADLGKDDQALKEATIPTEQIRLRDGWANIYRRRREDIKTELDGVQQEKTPLILIYSLVLTPIVSLGVTEFARWSWTNVPHLH